MPEAAQQDGDNIKFALEAKYSEIYTPTMDNNGVIHLAKVMFPRIDFSKVKPHLHRNLPKPDYYPLHGCSPDPDFYHKATQSMGYERGCQPKFECHFPSGLKAAFCSIRTTTGHQ